MPEPRAQSYRQRRDCACNLATASFSCGHFCLIKEGAAGMAKLFGNQTVVGIR
jgi:hypothetical protein